MHSFKSKLLLLLLLCLMAVFVVGCNDIIDQILDGDDDVNTEKTDVNYNNNDIANNLEESETNNNIENNSNEPNSNIIKKEAFDIYEVELYLDEVDNTIHGTIYNTEDGGQFFLDCNSGAYGHDGVGTDSDNRYNLYCGTYTADDGIEKVTVNGEDAEIIDVDERILWFYKYKGEEFADLEFIDK